MSKFSNVSFAALLLFLLTAVASCTIQNEDDGLWEPMKWTSDYSGDPRKITAPAEGGTYKLVCTNYRAPWFAGMTIDEETVLHGEEFTSHTIQRRWSIADLNGNTLTITIQPNITGKPRKLDIHVTAGDIFDHIEVTQEK